MNYEQVENLSLGVEIRDTTFAGNTASGDGGGLRANRTTALTRPLVQLSNVTVTANSAGDGGGLASTSPTAQPNFALSNTIVAANTDTAGGNAPDVFGALATVGASGGGRVGNNLFGNTAGGSGFVASDLINVAPLLGPLQNNGGPTRTTALLAGSPALSAGSNAQVFGFAPGSDQRIFPRNAAAGGPIDIGAFQLQNPTGVPDSYSTAFGATLNVAARGVLANDTGNDPPATPLTASLLSQPSGGSVQNFGADGSFTFVPTAGFSGPTTFTYIALNAGRASATTTVTVTVGPPGLPVAAPDAFPTPFNTALNVPARGVLANDSSPNPRATLTAARVAGPTAAQGTVVLNADGSFTFTPTAGFSGAASFTYAASDGAGTSTPATVTITVGVPPPAANLVLTLTNSSPTTDNTPTLTGTVNSANATDVTLTITGPGGALPPFTAAANAGAYTATVPISLPDGSYTVTAVGTDRVTRAVSNTATLTFVINTVVAPTRTFVVGGGAGAGPRVRTFDEAGATKLDFFAFDPTFLGGVRVAQGDLNGDGVDDVVAATGPGVESQVKAFDGKTGVELKSFFAYEPGYSNGVFVAVGDVNGDGKPDIVTGTSSGGAARVRVFDGATNFANVGGDANDFFVYDPNFRGGVRVAVGDINGDGVADIVTGAGVSGGPHVQGFSDKGGTRTQIANFFAYDTDFRGGIFVAVTGAGQIVTGPDGVPNSAGTIVSQLFAGLPNTTGGLANRPSTDTDLTTAPEVRVFDNQGKLVTATRPFDDTFANGVRVSAGTGSDGSTLLYAAAGETGGSRVKVYRLTAAGLAQVGSDVLAFEDTFLGSVYVGGTTRPVSR